MLFTTKPSVIVFRPTWKVNVKRMVLTSSRKWGQPPAVVCSACCRCSLKSTSHFVTQCNKLLQPHHKLWAIPHNSKCRYGERGAAAAKPKAQIILCVLSSILATQLPCRTPSRSEALRSATDALRRLLARRSAGAGLKPSGGNCAVLPLVYQTLLYLSITVEVRPMPTTASVIFFQLLHPQTPSAVRPKRRCTPFRAVSVLAPNTPSSVPVV